MSVPFAASDWNDCTPSKHIYKYGLNFVQPSASCIKKWFIQFYRRFLDQLNPHSTLMTPSRSSVPTCSFPESPLAKAPPGAPHFKLPCGCGDQLLENSQNQVFIGLETELLKNIRIYNQIITRILFKWELYSSYWRSQCFTCETVRSNRIQPFYALFFLHFHFRLLSPSLPT